MGDPGTPQDASLHDLARSPHFQQPRSMAWRRWARFLGVALTRPVEAWDRLRNMRQRAVDDEVAHYEPIVEWRLHLHRALGAAWPCSCNESLKLVTSALADEIPGLGVGHDADEALAEAVWIISAHLKPSKVVETGVARGITSRIILESLDQGHLWSIDLPPLFDPDASRSRSAVPGSLYAKWTYIRGDVRRHLPKLIDQLAPIDLFIHDSLHTREHMTFEFCVAERVLRSGGVLVADDIDENRAFEAVLANSAWDAIAIPQASRGGFFGVAIKRGPKRHRPG